MMNLKNQKNKTALCRKIRKAAGDRRGTASYLEAAIIVVILILLVAFFINIFSFFATYEELEYFGEQMIVAASAYGMTGDSRLNDRKDELCAELGLDPDKLTLDWTGTKYMQSGSSKVQLGDQIKITVRYQAKILGWGNEDLGTESEFTLASTHSGLSEKYWK